MDRRKFLLTALATSGGLTIGRGFLAPAFAAPAQPGESPYGPLCAPDLNGLRIPEGFRSRVIKQFGVPIRTTGQVGNLFPDGAGVVPTDDGGWILVSNTEFPPPADMVDPTPIGLDETGGVLAVRFAADGEIVDAYPLLIGSRSNCAGGITPWGTWLSCEELDDGDDAANSGKVYECDPFVAHSGVVRPMLGSFKHENATVDPEAEIVYMSEDLDDGLFYRFRMSAYPSLDEGVLEAAVVDTEGAVTWVEIPDPTCAGGVPCRRQAPAATPFLGGEGCVYDDGKVFLTTKTDDRVWMYDTQASTMAVLYDAKEFADPVLSGVDHIIVQPGTGNLVVAEDGGNLEVVMIRRSDFAVFPIVQLTGMQHNDANPGARVDLPATGLPGQDTVEDVIAATTSEVSGLAFNPAGDRLYFNSQRGFGGGITYEVQGPWLTTGADLDRSGLRRRLDARLPDFD